ncbi:MAG TPA: hypothetical protein VFW07_27975 [Parafilimonas sp.]|nr:hypothetical protein [Parafilimonas sp.]
MLKVSTHQPKEAETQEEEHRYEHKPSEAEHGHSHAAGEHGHAYGGVFGEKTELIFTIICGTLLGIGFGLSFVKGLSSYISIGFYIGAYLFGGFYTTKEAIEGIMLLEHVILYGCYYEEIDAFTALGDKTVCVPC